MLGQVCCVANVTSHLLPQVLEHSQHCVERCEAECHKRGGAGEGNTW